MAYYPERRNMFDDWFDDAFDAPFFGNNRVMRTDISEKDGYYTLEIELPGIKKEDVKVSLENGTLTVSAERKAEENDKGRAIRKERYEGSISRSWYVGDSIREGDVKASFDNGILKITLPTAEKKKQEDTRVINID